MTNRFDFLLRPDPKELVRALIGGLLTVFFVIAFTSQFGLLIDTQDETCFDQRVYLKFPLRGEIKKDDLIVFSAKGNVFFGLHEGSKVGKLVVGLPGDEINIKDETVFVNGQEVAHINPGIYQTFRVPVGKFNGRYLLASDEYFVLGVNPRSFDSRYWGPIKRDSIEARAIGLI
jgi:conjugal transfer pilin signal peptidase TrbI